MKILFYTVFYPSVGGMEAIAEILADEWTRSGHEVTIVTRVLEDPRVAKRTFAYPIVRNPGVREFLRLTRGADVFMQNGISLRGLWPLLLVRRPYVVKHGIWYDSPEDTWGFLKKWVSRYAVNIAVSQAVSRTLPGSSTIIYNPYDDGVFYIRDGIARTRDLAFVGRLVSDKGVKLLLQAMAQLKQRGVCPSLTVIGDGPERAALEQQVSDTGLTGQVIFVGRKRPAEIAQLLSAHKILVVPSRWNEPFGIVALEGIACGCAVIGSAGGGLPEAMGACGVTFSNDNVEELADRIFTLLGDDAARLQLLTHGPAHLRDLHATKVATRYLAVIQQAVARKN